MQRSTLTLRAVDGRPLAASFYAARAGGSEAEAEDAPAKVVVIAPAMAVRKSLYHHFAAHLSARGMHVLTFDYRGTGASRGVGKDDGNLTRWGELDLEGALQYVARRFPGAKTCVVAHSVSGHLLPLAPSAERLDAALIMATPAASWRKWPGAMRLLVWALCHFVLPVMIAVRGFLPGHYLGGPEDLHGEVIREWAAWGRAPLSPGETRAASLSFPLGLLSFDADRYGPQQTVGALGASYTNAKREHRHVAAGEAGALGHFGWANATDGRRLWDGIATWIERTLDAQPVALLPPALLGAADGPSDEAPALGPRVGHPVTASASPLRPPSTEGL